MSQKGAVLQLNHQLIDWLRQSPSPFRPHLTEHQSKPVIALLWRTDGQTDGRAGLCLAPLESEARWDNVNGHISASHTHRRLSVYHSLWRPEWVPLWDGFFSTFQVRWMIVSRKRMEFGKRLYPICMRCQKSAVNWREIFTLPELGDAALAGSASLILYKDLASFISATPPPPRAPVSLRLGCTVLWVSTRLTGLCRNH